MIHVKDYENVIKLQQNSWINLQGLNQIYFLLAIILISANHILRKAEGTEAKCTSKENRIASLTNRLKNDKIRFAKGIRQVLCI